MENNTSAYYDNEATKYITLATSQRELADRASNPEETAGYQTKANEYRDKAIAALERAKIAAARR
jgi:hypothetical protein